MDCLLWDYRSLKVLYAVIGLSFILIAPSSNTRACPLELPTATISIKSRTLTVELAATPSARACGLSHRSKLPQNHGMLFIFPNPIPATFWMKDTWIPLSIAFIDNAGKIMNIEDMTPMQTEVRYSSSGWAQYALEVNQGWFKSNGIGTGDRVVMELPLAIDIK